MKIIPDVSAVRSQARQSIAVTAVALLLLSGCSSAPQNTGSSGFFDGYEASAGDISKFHKWTGVQARISQQPQSGREALHLQSMTEQWRLLPQEQQIVAVNDFFNAIAYADDIDNYGQSDYWATPVEVMTQRKADCEDYAIAKYESLSALGMPRGDMRIAIVYDRFKRTPHAVLILKQPGGDLVLDNQTKDIKSARHVNRYQPLYSVTGDSVIIYKARSV